MVEETAFDSKCIFCKIINGKESLLYLDEDVAAFHDIKKGGAVEHVLVVSKSHIKNVNWLRAKDEDLVVKMRKVGTDILSNLQPGKKPSSEFRFGFHAPPFNSIDHLHLHCYVEPFNSFFYKHFVAGWGLRPVEKVIQDLKAKI